MRLCSRQTVTYECHILGKGLSAEPWQSLRAYDLHTGQLAAGVLQIAASATSA